MAALGVGIVAGGCAYGAGNTYTWNTAGLTASTYRFQVWIRRSGSTKQFETSAQATFTLQRP